MGSRRGNGCAGWHEQSTADGDAALDALSDIGALRRLLDQAELAAVRAARGRAKSWAEIATRLGVTRQSAWERWRDLDDTSDRDVEVAAAGAAAELVATVLGSPTELVPVPDVIGLEWDTARRVLASGRLVAASADPDGPPLSALSRRPDRRGPEACGGRARETAVVGAAVAGPRAGVSGRAGTAAPAADPACDRGRHRRGDGPGDPVAAPRTGKAAPAQPSRRERGHGNACAGRARAARGRRGRRARGRSRGRAARAGRAAGGAGAARGGGLPQRIDIAAEEHGEGYLRSVARRARRNATSAALVVRSAAAA